MKNGSGSIYQRNENKLLYKQIEDYLMEKIRKEIFKPGEIIPSERELSKELGVSRYTVRKAIQELVREGYLYRVQGNGTFVFEKKPLLERANQFIGVVLPSCNTEMEMKILKGIQKGFQSLDYKMTFVDSQNNYLNEAKNIHRLKQEGAVGLIIMPAEDQKESNAIADLKTEGFPFVLVDRRLQNYQTDCVMSDNIEGGYLATEHLIKLGHERIAFIKHESIATSSVVDRIKGYKKALKDYGLKFKRICAFKSAMNKKINKHIFELYDYLQEEKPTAVVALNDYVALDIIKLCRLKNITIPDDLSLISFDDLDIVRYLEVPLTTIRQSSYEIGYHAAQLLEKKIKEKSQGNKRLNYYNQIFYEVKLIERSSCIKLN